MKLIDLKLKGFIGLKKGLGLDEISLPLGDLAGLVAFDGPNGRGKTTILENMQPFRQFASRAGGLKKHCFAKDSQKELTVEYNGDIIRTLIKMDAQTTRSDEGFIWVNDKSIVDGKVTSYDKAIAEIFGSSNLFFWSIFCAQNSKKLTDLTTGKLKELFTEFLRLDRYADFEDTIRQTMSMLTGIGQAIDSDRKVYFDQLAKFDGLDPEKTIKTEGDLLEKNQKELEDTMQQIDLMVKGIQEKKAEIAANEQKEKQRKALSLDLVAAKADQTDLEKEKTKKLSAIADKMAKINLEIKAIHRKLENAEAIREASVQCLNLNAKINQSGLELDMAYKARDTMQGELNQLTRQKEKAERLVHELATRKAEIEAFVLEKDPEYIAMNTKIESLKSQTVALTQKDKDCVSQTCGLIIGALDATDQLETLGINMEEYSAGWIQGHKSSLEEVAGKLKEAQGAFEAIEAKVQNAADTWENMQMSINRRITEKREMQDKFDSLSGLAKLAPELEVATAQLSSNEKQEADLKTALGELESEYSDKIKAAQARIHKIADRMAEIVVDNQAIEDLARLENGLEAGQAITKRLQASIRDSEHKILEATKAQDRINSLLHFQKDAETRFKKVAYEQTEWSYLREACGKKGLQALEIDGVSPVIEAYANDLLISTFGPMNTIRFETVDPDGKEVLNIVVMDTDGSETLLDLKSGGEQVWILKALRLALTLISKEKSGRNFKTVLMDEEDGALSPGNAVRFINLYRSMMDIGGFDTCFYISHKPEAVALANHRLVFNHNGIGID